MLETQNCGLGRLCPVTTATATRDLQGVSSAEPAKTHTNHAVALRGSAEKASWNSNSNIRAISADCRRHQGDIRGYHLLLARCVAVKSKISLSFTGNRSVQM